MERKCCWETAKKLLGKNFYFFNPLWTEVINIDIFEILRILPDFSTRVQDQNQRLIVPSLNFMREMLFTRALFGRS